MREVPDGGGAMAPGPSAGWDTRSALEEQSADHGGDRVQVLPLPHCPHLTPGPVPGRDLGDPGCRSHGYRSQHVALVAQRVRPELLAGLHEAQQKAAGLGFASLPNHCQLLRPITSARRARAHPSLEISRITPSCMKSGSLAS